MHDEDLTDDRAELLLTGTALPGDNDLSEFIGEVRAAWSGSKPTPVGCALSEFVELNRTIDFGIYRTASLSEFDSPVIDLASEPKVRSPRRSTMRWKKISAGALVAAAGIALLGSIASAETSFEDGDYSLTLPGIGSFDFTIDSDSEGDTVVAIAAPEGYEVDDDDPDKAAWKDAASLEVEVKTDKVEGDYDWSSGDAALSLPDGGSIAISEPDGDGKFTVTASGGWFAFGDGSDWVVADSDDISTATKFFKVEATEDGVEIKPTDEPGDGFLNDLEEEVEEEEVEEEEKEEKGNGHGRGRGGNNEGS